MPTDDITGPLVNTAETSHRRNRVGCASDLIVLENVEQSPSGEPFSDDCYTIRLHNADHDQGLSVSEISGKRSAGYRYAFTPAMIARKRSWSAGRVMSMKG